MAAVLRYGEALWLHLSSIPIQSEFVPNFPRQLLAQILCIPVAYLHLFIPTVDALTVCALSACGEPAITRRNKAFSPCTAISPFSLRHAYAFASGLSLTILLLGPKEAPVGLSWLFLQAFAGYLIMRCCNRRITGRLTFLTCFFILTAFHFLLRFDHPARGPLMNMTLLVVSCAMDFQDSSSKESALRYSNTLSEPKSPPLAPQSQCLQCGVSATVQVHPAMFPESGHADPKSGTWATAQNDPAVLLQGGQVREAPGLLEFLGYCFCDGQFLGAVAYFFADYKDWTEENGAWGAAGWTRGKARRGCFQPALGSVLQGTLALSVGAQLHEHIFSQASTLGTGQAQQPFYTRWLYCHLLSLWLRCLGYSMWAWGEAAMATSGLGFSGWQSSKGCNAPLTMDKLIPGFRPILGLGNTFSGETSSSKMERAGKEEPLEGDTIGMPSGQPGPVGKPDGNGNSLLRMWCTIGPSNTASKESTSSVLLPRWGRNVGVRMELVEFPPDCGAVMRNWNVSVGRWLRNYVYLRLPNHQGKPGLVAVLVTMTVSAFWHGTSGGMYLSALGMGLCIFASRILSKWQRQIKGSGFLIEKACAVAHTTFAIFFSAICCSAFVVRSFEGVLALWGRLHFINLTIPGTIVLLGFLAEIKQLKPVA